MGQKTFRYSIVSIFSLFLLLLSAPAMAQWEQGKSQNKRLDQEVGSTTKKEKKKSDDSQEEKTPLYNGVFFGVDVYGIGARLFGSDFLSSQVSAAVDLKGMFLPTLEVGYGTTDTWNETGIHYKGSAPYFRIGVDYNTKAKKQEKSSFLYAGIRYGLSPMKYDISSMPFRDPIYGGEVANPSLEDYIGGSTVPYDHRGLKATMQWFEFVVGVNVQIYKSFYMGWAFRLKYKLSLSGNEYSNPWYVPGYGQYKSNNMGITYSLIYKLR